MAEFDEVVTAIGYVVRAVPPVTIKVLVDNSVNTYGTVIDSGVLGFALSLKGADLMQLLGNAEQGQCTST